MTLEVIILAAGQGTRMRSPLPKVLHPVAGRPMLARVVDTARRLHPARIHVVVGHGADAVRAAIPEADLNWVEQAQRLGTGHAVQQALPDVAEGAVVLVLYGDVPLVGVDILQRLAEAAREQPALLTAVLEEPTGYGRILRDSAGQVTGVVEEKDANPEERGIREVNTGLLAAPAPLLRALLPRVGNANRQGEYYLPDILSLHVAGGGVVCAATAASEIEILGVNDRLQLSRVEREFQRRRAEELLREGVDIVDPARFDLRGNLRCGDNVRIDINAVIEGDVELGDNVVVGPNCVLIDCAIQAGTRIRAMSHLENVQVGAECRIGPYARLRPGTVMADHARVGNFVETKKARIGAGSKVNHLSYIGDCEMGDAVNVGAGTITCNYDGVNKHTTEIGDGAFLGSNSTLVAPVEVAAGGFVAAGSTITRAVGADELAVGRGRQRNIAGWQRPRAPKQKKD